MLTKPTAAQKKAALSLFICPTYWDEYLRRRPDMADAKKRKIEATMRRTRLNHLCDVAESRASALKWIRD